MERANGGTPSSRAERFEDEKRRIIESCFNKKEPDGSVQETYITHIRVLEFSSHASSPPPPQARTPDSEKPRVIIIAVRKSGRVRMHKSKENSNLTFSIGKTWNLDDLTQIESYTGPQCNPNFREWAGDTGFTATIGKQYYWQAQSDKEKKFFIASMIKIYSKYTNGKLPELTGFDQKELDQVMGAGRRPAGSQQPPPQRPGLPVHPPSQQSNLSAASGGPAVQPDASRPHRAPPIRQPPSGNASPAGSFDSTASTSRDKLALRKVAQNNISQDSFAAKSDDASSLPPRSRNGPQGPGSYGRFGDQYRKTPEPSEPPSQPLPPPPPQSTSRPITPVTPKEDRAPPERRRPPMEPLLPHDRDLVPPPLKSPGMKREGSPRDTPREPMAPPPRSAERMSPRESPPGSQKLPPSSLAASVQEQDPPPMAALKPAKSEPTKPEPPPLEPPPSLKMPSSSSLPKEVVSEPPAITETPIEMAPEEAASPPPKEPVPPVPADAEEESRPGLGPMIKSKKSKNDVAGALWKAASAVSAFKPRPGGAGERLRQLAQQNKAEGPDGITSVVPAPRRPPTRENRETESETPAIPERKADHKPNRASLVPEVKISVPDSSRSRPSSSQGAPKEVTKAELVKPEEPAAPRKSVVPAQDAKYLQTLGVDPALLDARSDEFGTWLDYFGWVPGEQMRSRAIDDMRIDLDRELNKAQAGGWLARFKEEDERVDAIKKGIDVAMTECDEMDNLLTLYSVELSTLSEDIAYIEAQGQGLQVQTANQKLLKKELESLLETCAITSSDLEVLRIAPLDNLRGLEDVENSLVTLFKAMIKMDPTLGGREPKAADATIDSDQIIGLNNDYGQMRIVQEKKEMYHQESADFMRRLIEFMARQFDEAFAETKRALEGALAKKVDPSNHDVGRDLLWKYSPLMLYARDADLGNWNRLIQVYQDKIHPLYKAEFQSVVAIWRKNARKLTGEEAELLFSSHIEKQQEGGVAQTARKLTVKRSQTLARALRSPLADGERKSAGDKSGADSRSMPYVVFAGVLDDLLPLVEMEQNFVIDFFHATTLEQIDFPDAVAAFKPRDRRGGDLKRHRLMEPDRDLARRVTRPMEVIFAFLEAELQRLMEWVIGQDPLQGVGVLATLEKQLATISQSNQEYLNNTLHKLHALLAGRFRKFVDEQIRAIEETKVKISKRKGVISFIRVFPAFSIAVENMLAGLDANLAIRRTVDGEYDRILRSMFDSLKVIARENPAVGASHGNTDPEDKEALNFHILLIENANHFVEETDTRGLEILEEWKENANAEYHEHMELYLNAVMRRPLGKLLDHLENIEAQLQSGKGPSAIAAQPSNSKNIFNKVLGAYDSKEVRKGIEALRKRVEKHFGDADDEALSRGLVAKVLRECEAFYGTVEGRIGRITTDVYGGDVLFEWPRADVKAAFR